MRATATGRMRVATTIAASEAGETVENDSNVPPAAKVQTVLSHAISRIAVAHQKILQERGLMRAKVRARTQAKENRCDDHRPCENAEQTNKFERLRKLRIHNRLPWRKSDRRWRSTI